MRSFIAVELPEAARGELSRIISLLKGTDADVKWVRPGSVHFTLKFLGNVQDEEIPVIARKLRKAVSNVRPFDITLEGMGVFPGWEYVKVLWVGLSRGADEIKVLAGRIEKAMQDEGFQKENRDFKPHLTLGRVRSPKNRERLREQVTSIIVNNVAIYVDRIVFFKSELTREGAIYTPIETVVLGG